MRITTWCWAACAALVLAAPAHAMQRPEVLVTVGSTTMVDGDPGEGGMSLSLSTMWETDTPFEVGLMVFADDCGTDMGRLHDMHDGSDLGTVENLHRFAYGGAWRVDAPLPALPGRFAPFASASWGAYRVQDDVRGEPSGAITATGFSVGAGVRHAFLPSSSIGASGRWHRVQRGPSAGWLDVSLDWQTRWGRRH
jgi:hypothetical protein